MPEAGYVVQNEGAIEDSGVDQTPPQPQPTPIKPYSAPASWKETFALEYFTFYFDTPVRVPDMKAYPVFSVRQRMLSVEEVKDFIALFISNAQEYAKPVRTKADIGQEIADAKRGYWDGNKFVHYPDEDKMISDLEKQRQEAPEQPEYQNIGAFQISELPFRLDFYFEDHSKVNIAAGRSSISISKLPELSMQPEAWVVRGSAMPGEAKGTRLSNVKIREEGALIQAQSILEQAGLSHLSLISAEKARLIMDRSREVASEGWRLMFGRSDAGYIPVDLTDFAENIYRNLQAAPEYSAPLNMEYMELYLDENGLQRLYWTNPLEMIDTLDEHVALIDFADIQAIVKQQLKNEWAWVQETSQFYDQSQTIYDMTLSYSLLPAKDDTNTAMLVPTWFVYYILKNDLEQVDAFVPSLLVINAVDGSIIDPIAPNDDIWVE